MVFPEAERQLKKLEEEFTKSHPKEEPKIETEPDAHAVVSVFDLFSIGIGPSSSHTVGPMRAAYLFVNELKTSGIVLQLIFSLLSSSDTPHHQNQKPLVGTLDKVESIRAELYGSLALTGVGHGTPLAVLVCSRSVPLVKSPVGVDSFFPPHLQMGLEGEQPQAVDPESIEGRVKKIQTGGELNLLKERKIKFDYQKVAFFSFFSFLFPIPLLINSLTCCHFSF